MVEFLVFDTWEPLVNTISSTLSSWSSRFISLRVV